MLKTPPTRTSPTASPSWKRNWPRPPPPRPPPAVDTTALEKRLAETEGRLTTALRGYALLEKTRDEQQTKATQAAAAAAAENSTLSGRVTALSSELDELKTTVASQSTTQASAAATENAESLAALQRSSSTATADAATARALAQQLQGANSVLAQENYRLKTVLAGANGGTAPSISTPTPPVGSRTHVIAAGDSLSKLSQRYYGTATRWQEIYNANTDKLGPQGILRVGVELRIP